MVTSKSRIKYPPFLSPIRLSRLFSSGYILLHKSDPNSEELGWIICVSSRSRWSSYIHCMYTSVVMIINYSTTRRLNLEETTRIMRAFVHLHIQTLCTAWRLCDESCSRANDDARWPLYDAFLVQATQYVDRLYLMDWSDACSSMSICICRYICTYIFRSDSFY